MQSTFRWGNTAFPLKISIFFLCILGALGSVFAQITPVQHAIQGNYSIAAVRVQFQKDTIATTTGTGQIDLSPTPAGADTLIDPPPHNKSYFEAQILALNNYYSTVSNGMVTANNSEVFPSGENDAYTLSEPMSYYSRAFVDSIRNRNWAKLVYDVYLKCRDDVNFSDFSTLAIFHAGVGQDFSITLDNTPFDIQSAYLDAPFLQQNLPADQWQSLKNAGIEHVLILPETQNQLNIKLGVTGTFALLFGSRIGLPSLYNTDTGKSVIGKFGLMDQGSANGNGVAPAPPCAWTKIYAGWASSRLASEAGQFWVRSPEINTAVPTIVKIPINNSEYYLVENRQRKTRTSNLQQFIVGFDTLYVQRQNGVITKVDEYDAGLPGDGLLIWHIDESVIRDSLANDAINNNPDRHGVDLEEADGAQDLGQNYGPLSSGIENGWFFDFWFAGNLGFFDLNPDYRTDSDSTIGFTPDTHPATLTNSGSYSGIAITKIPDAAPVMSFNLQFIRNVSGFPVDLGDVTFSHSQVVQDGKSTFVFAGIPGSGSENRFALIKQQNGTTTSRIISFANQGFSTSTLQDLAAYRDESGRIQLIYFTQLANQNENGIFTKVGVVNVDTLLREQFTNGFQLALVPGAPLGNVIYQNGSVTFGTDQDTLYNFSVTHEMNWKTSIPSPPQSLAVDPDGNYIIGTNRGLFRIKNGTLNTLAESGNFQSVSLVGGDKLLALRDGKPALATFSNLTSAVDLKTLQPEINGSPLTINSMIAADPDEDGNPEPLALASDANGEWMLAAWNLNNSVVNNFPMYLTGTYTNSTISQADIDGDGIAEYFVQSDVGKIYGYSSDGQLLLHYPIDTGSKISAPLILSRINGNRTALFSLGDSSMVNGYFSLIDPEVKGGTVWWSGRNGNSTNTRYIPAFTSTVTPGNSLTIRRAYIYPNPVKDNRGTIRVEAENADHITVSIFDFSGHFISQMEQSANSSQTVYEFPWDASKLPSGVYFGNVVVKRSGIEESKTIKIAVIR